MTKKLKTKAENIFSFETSLDPNDIPRKSAPWDSNEHTYPVVTASIFKQYALHKREGRLGQQQKAYSMLTSRKIVSVKTLKVGDGNYVKALVKKSYGEQMRPATIFFKCLVPLNKGFCECPVGGCGLCCHVLAILLYLKHHHQTKEK